MMLNTSQNLDQWQAYFDKPTGSSLGLMNAIYQIGSLASFPLVYVDCITDSRTDLANETSPDPTWLIGGDESFLLLLAASS
jgi:hypothetical protein